MEFSWTIFVIGLTLGVIQVAVGVAVGKAFSSHRGKAAAKPASQSILSPEPLDLEQLRSFANRLLRLINGVSSDVGQHQVRIEQMTKDLTTLKNTNSAVLAGQVLDRVAQIVDANRQLQGRLTRVEGRLRQQAEQMAVHVTEARTDPLTRLANRRAFDDEMGQRLGAWREDQDAFSLMMIDLDNLKPLNDRHGHLAGDELLRVLAATLSAQIGATDLAARIGGDEFALVLGEADLDRAKRRAGKVLDAVAGIRFNVDGEAARVNASVGVARIEGDEDNAALIHRADKALYAAKRAGKGRAFYHDGLECLPVRPEDAADPNAPDAEPEDELVLKELCDDVRSRLDEVLRPAEVNDDAEDDVSETAENAAARRSATP